MVGKRAECAKLPGAVQVMGALGSSGRGGTHAIPKPSDILKFPEGEKSKSDRRMMNLKTSHLKQVLVAELQDV